ncbi:asparagine synthase-related protein [Francisella philomiragia]|uniref:asparagine synthase-related protein n=1 Tax=Francisella philomiragia TaxID=28110 RepID=UPI0005A57F02|nr:asparagine synthase-related protein [Francisella philomiragia]AJI57619.1 glutamine amidotransferase domain protein [Francisella philomiragia]
MFHGVFSRKNNNLAECISPQIYDGSDNILNIDSQRKVIKTISGANYWLAQAVEKQSTEGVYSYSNHIIVGWVKLYNRDEIFVELELESLDNLSDMELIARLYQKYNNELPKYLHGDYSFVIYNMDKNEFLCVRDHMGTRPFYYYLDDDYFVFSTSQVLFNHLGNIIKLSASQEWICRLLVGGTNMSFEKTAYNEIFKVPPAHFLNVDTKKSIKQRYFDFSTQKISYSSIEEYFREYEQRVKKAVLQRFRDSKTPVGSEISGGIDSSTVTSYIAKFFDQPLSNLYTYGFARLDQAPEYILLVNQAYHIPNAFICSGNDPHHKNPLEILGSPIEHGNATAHEIFYRDASNNGVRSLFSGFGGDEFVTSIHGDLVYFELLKERRYIELFKIFGGNFITKPLRFLRFVIKNNPKRGKKSLRMLEAFRSRWSYFVVKQEYIKKHKLESRYLNLGKFDDGYTSMDKFTLEKRWVSFVPTRTENCSLVAAAYGIDYFWPLLDYRLIQFFLSVPNTLKIGKGFGRYLHRKSVEKVVPSKIIWKKSKYMGEPFSRKINVDHKLVLDQDLHPQLQQLIDIKKLSEQVDKFKELKKGNYEKEITLMRNVVDVNSVNEWLKHFNLDIK